MRLEASSIAAVLVERASAVATEASAIWVIPGGLLAEDIASRLRGKLPSAEISVFGAVTNEGLMVSELFRGQVTVRPPDIIVIASDNEKETVLRELNAFSWKTIPRIVAAGTGHLLLEYQFISKIERSLPAKSAASGYELVKAHLYDVIKFHAKKRTRGYIVELGVFKGGTTLLVAEIARQVGLQLDGIVGFDTFAGFPAKRSILDAFDLKEFVYEDFSSLESAASGKGITLVCGDIYETANVIEGRHLILTFVDTDNYSAVHKALPVCARNTIAGGAIIFDHYFTQDTYWQTIGERIAAVEFFSGRDDFLHLAGTGVFIKV